MRLTEEKVLTRLRQNNYKLTPQRQVVIKEITSNQEHLTPTDIYEKVHRDHPNIGLVTIYRTLTILVKLKLICELHSGDSCPSYTISATGHHHHLLCIDCGKVFDYLSCDLEEAQQSLSKQTWTQNLSRSPSSYEAETAALLWLRLPSDHIRNSIVSA